MSIYPLPRLAFYEKPGCSSNHKQKAQLTAMGFELEVHSLLSTPWSPAELKKYFAAHPVEQWFNRGAPAVKEGRINPAVLSSHQALELFVQEPLLIRRPLIRTLNGDTHYWAGFDVLQLLADLGLPAELAATQPQLGEGCSSRPEICEAKAQQEASL